MRRESKHCCEVMDGFIDPKCVQHANPKDCEDALVFYDLRFDSYALLARFGSPWVTNINFCPWCGDPKRDLRDTYFDTLERMGFDEPLSQEIPEPFRTDQWWKEANL